MTYNILSPDRIPISPNNFATKKEGEQYFKQWVKAYKKQGFYSSPQYGRISLRNIWEYCSIQEIENNNEN